MSRMGLGTQEHGCHRTWRVNAPSTGLRVLSQEVAAKGRPGQQQGGPRVTGGQGGGLRRRLGSPRSQSRGTAGAPALPSRARESTSRGDGTRRGVGRGDDDKIAGRKVRAWTGLRAILPETDSDPDPAAERLLTRRRSPRRRQGDAGVVTAAGARTRGGRSTGTNERV